MYILIALASEGYLKGVKQTPTMAQVQTRNHVFGFTKDYGEKWSKAVKICHAGIQMDIAMFENMLK